MLEVKDVTYQYRQTDENGNATVVSNALDHVSLTIADGEMVAIVGHNGSGKSTLAKLFNGLLLPTEGKVLANGLDTADEANTIEIRRHVGLVFQNPDNQLVTSIVEEDVGFGPENLGVPPAEIRTRVDEALAAVSMQDYATRASYALSGGQKQRIAIAGMLAMHPDTLVLDEATAMLDPLGRREILSIVGNLHREQGMSVVMITQYMEEVEACDRVIVMDSGHILFTGTPKQVFARADELRQCGLDVPEAVHIRDTLIHGGLPVMGDPITIEDLAEAICQSF